MLRASSRRSWHAGAHRRGPRRRAALTPPRRRPPARSLAAQIGKALRNSDADLIFMKAKERTARKLTFDQFVDALDMVASKKQLTVAEVARLVLDA